MGVSKGTYAARPSSHAAGDIYLTTDSFWDYLVSDGVSWKHLIGGLQCTPPNDSEFSWLRQEGATTTTTNGGVFIRVPAGSPAYGHYRIKDAPAIPYTLCAAFLPTLCGANYPFCEIILRDSATSDFLGIRTEVLGYGSISVIKQGGVRLRQIYLDAGTRSLLWFSLTFDGTDITANFSGDGTNFVTVYSANKSSVFTNDPNQIGWGADAINANYDAGGTLIHWSLPGPAPSAAKCFGFWGRSIVGIGQADGNCVGVFG